MCIRWHLLLLTSVAVLSFGCSEKPLIPYSLDTPPLVLWPTAKTDVVDGRGRFREIYSAVRDDHGRELPEDRPVDEALLGLAGEGGPTGRAVHLGRSRSKLRVLVVPGIFGECIADVVSPFTYALAHLEEHGYETGLIPVSGRSSTLHNAGQIRDFLVAMDRPPDEKLVLVGYSKGTADTLVALSTYPEVRDRVQAMVSVSGGVSGSPLADEVTKPLLRLTEEIDLPTCPPGDGDAVADLTRSSRLKWLSENELPESVRYFSLVSFADIDGTSKFLQESTKKLARLDPRNDSQVIFYDAIIPNSTLLGYVNADHWAVALPFSRNLPKISAALLDHNAFPREVLLESIVRFVEESLEDTASYPPPAG